MAIVFQKTNPYTAPQTYHLKREDFFAMTDPFILSGNIVDVDRQKIYTGRLHIAGGRIRKIEPCHVLDAHYILPAFVNAFLQLKENSPLDFANEAVKSGTLAALVVQPVELDFKFFFTINKTVMPENTPIQATDICEAEEQINLGRKIIINETSFNSLYPLINQYPHSLMLAINECQTAKTKHKVLLDLFKSGLDKGLNFYNLLNTFSTNTINHYNLPIGLLRENDFADCFIVDNLQKLTVLQSYIDGIRLFDSGL